MSSPTRNTWYTTSRQRKIDIGHLELEEYGELDNQQLEMLLWSSSDTAERLIALGLLLQHGYLEALDLIILEGDSEMLDILDTVSPARMYYLERMSKSTTKPRYDRATKVFNRIFEQYTDEAAYNAIGPNTRPDDEAAKRIAAELLKLDFIAIMTMLDASQLRTIKSAWRDYRGSIVIYMAELLENTKDCTPFESLINQLSNSHEVTSHLIDLERRCIESNELDDLFVEWEESRNSPRHRR